MAGDIFAASVIILVILSLVYVLKRYFGINLVQENSQMERYTSRPPPVGAVSVHNPFSVLLESPLSPDKSPIGSINLLVVPQEDCILRSFWNVDVNEVLHARSRNFSVHNNENCTESGITRYLKLHSQTFSSPKPLRKACTGEPYQHVCQMDDDPLQTLSLKSRNEINRPFNLVVTLELPQEVRERTILNENIVCLLTVIEHDSQRNGGSNKWIIRNQFIQTASDKIFTLKTLYASGVPDLEADSLPESDETELCIICHASPVTRALLPCRHKCICGACFPRTKLCPICRKFIESYLVIADEAGLPLPAPDAEELQQQTREGLGSMGALELIRAIWNAS